MFTGLIQQTGTIASLDKSRATTRIRVSALELPTPAGTPLGGHIVQGHVDATGKLISLEPASTGSEDRWLDVEIPEALTRYVVEKGSITVEGISLTVASIAGTGVRIAIIPH